MVQPWDTHLPRGPNSFQPCTSENPALRSHPWVLWILEAGEQKAARQSPRRCPETIPVGITELLGLPPDPGVTPRLPWGIPMQGQSPDHKCP